MKSFCADATFVGKLRCTSLHVSVRCEKLSHAFFARCDAAALFSNISDIERINRKMSGMRGGSLRYRIVWRINAGLYTYECMQ